MDKFVIRKRTSDTPVDEIQSNKQKPSNTERLNSVSRKTAIKWTKELNVNLELSTSDSDPSVVTKMYCRTCKEFAPSHMSSNFVTGNTSLKRESVVFHVRSAMHIRAVEIKAAKAKLARHEPTDLEKGFQHINMEESEKMNKLFKTAYYIAINERPFTDFPDLIDLQQLNGLSMGDTYRNDTSAKLFIKNIGGIYHDEVKRLIHESDYLSIFCDGSTDRSETEKEVIYVKVLEDYYPKMKYLKLEEPDNTKAEGILSAIDRAFLEFDLQNYKQKTIGFCSDGASVMMGARRGVIQLLKQSGNADWIVPVWCLAHRLELAIKDAFKATYMDKVIEMLLSVYYFYRGSAKRNKEATEIADILGEHFLKPEKANGTRWVDHKLRAVSKMIQNYPIIITHMENYAEDSSNKAEDRAKTKGYIRQLKQHKMLWYMSFVKDVLNEVAKISLLFQRDDLTVSSAVTKLQSAEATLRALIENDGPSVEEINELIVDGKFHDITLQNIVAPDVLSNDRRRIVQSVLDCISVRFENLLERESVFLSCHAFDHKNWPLPTDQNALAEYGKEDVRLIFRHFHTVLTNAGCDLVQALSQWCDLKFHVSGNARYQNQHPLLVWQLVSQMDSDKKDYNDILKIIHLTSCLPLSNATCERAFSVMKRIKSDWRCRLSANMINILMRIRIENVSLREFNPNPAVQRWWIAGQREKRPNQLPYGPRN